MNIVGLAIRQPVTVAVGVILLIMAGLIAATRIPIQLTPNVESTIISVNTIWEGASPGEIEQNINDKQEERLLVSRNAILRNEAGAFLYVARQPPGAAGGEAARAVPLRVTVSFGVGDRVVVQGAGLAEGDLVVVEGNERLFPMMPVIPIPAEDDRAPAEEPGGET